MPGADLPKVTHYYREPYPYVGQKVAVIGARNSAAKAALDCYRHGAQVTLIVRSPQLSDKIKYWIRPDLENRIKEGSIRALFNTVVECIGEGSLTLRGPEGTFGIENDWVLAMTGYHPDYGFLEQVLQIGIARGPVSAPRCSTRRRSRPPVRESTWLARSAGATGPAAGSSRTAGSTPARSSKHITQGRADRVPFERIHWKTEE